MTLLSTLRIVTPDDRTNTTVWLKGFPRNYNSQNYNSHMLIELLNHFGLEGKFNFIHFPYNHETGLIQGWGAVNMYEHESALTLIIKFTDFTDWGLQGVAGIVQAPNRGVSGWYQIQGRDALINRYIDSPVTDDGVDDERKPMLFHNGLRIPFPPRVRQQGFRWWNWDDETSQWETTVFPGRLSFLHVYHTCPLPSAEMTSGAAEAGDDLVVPSTDPAPSCTSIKTPPSCIRIVTPDDRDKTTVCVQNVPPGMLQMWLTHIGLDGKFDFIHVERSTGSAVVNVHSHDLALTLIIRATGFTDWGLQGIAGIAQAPNCGVAGWYKIQGRDALIRRYIDSPVTNDCVDDERKPMLFHNGRRIPFPHRAQGQRGRALHWNWHDETNQWETILLQECHSVVPRQEPLLPGQVNEPGAAAMLASSHGPSQEQGTLPFSRLRSQAGQQRQHERQRLRREEHRQK